MIADTPTEQLILMTIATLSRVIVIILIVAAPDISTP